MKRTYSLWLVCDEVSCRRLQTTIDSFARQFSTPVFLPHLTLYGGIHSDDESAVIAKCRETVRHRQPLELHLETTGMEDERFRCLYIRVRNTQELAALFRRAEAVFGKQREWYPHISLLYGVVPSGEKERALRGQRSALPGKAEAIALALYDTSGDVHEWREVIRLPLQ